MHCIICDSKLSMDKMVGHKLWCGECQSWQLIPKYIDSDKWKDMLRNFSLSSVYSDFKSKRAICKQDKRLKHLEKHVKHKNAIWDIGAGGGWLLRSAQKRGWDHVTGNELSLFMVGYCLGKYDITVRYGFLNELAIQDTYDAVTYINSLEHMMNPAKSLQMAMKMLTDDGVIFVAGMPEENLTHSTDYHAWEFSDAGYSKLWDRVGLVLLDKKEPSGEEDLTYWVLGSRHAK